MKRDTWDDSLLAGHRAFITSESAKAAFDELVTSAVALSGFSADFAFHGNIRDFRYFDLNSADQPFAFIVNRAHLLFYVRAKGLIRVPGGFLALKDRFATAKETAGGEWTVRIETRQEAERLNSFLFSSQADASLSPDYGEARSVMLAALPDEHARWAVLRQLVTSSDLAESVAPSAWAVTLFDDGFRLTVGQLEVFVLGGNSIRLNLLGEFGTPPFTGPLFVQSNYRSMPDIHCAFVGSAMNFTRLSSTIREAHLQFVRGAATTMSGEPRTGTPHRASHSQALIRYAQAEVATYTDAGMSALREESRTDALQRAAGSGVVTEAPEPIRSAAESVLVDLDQSPDAVEERDILARMDIGPTTKKTLIYARLGQGLFRERVIHLERRCRVTGVECADHLCASHIKPWRASSDHEKLDGENGLLLAPHIDHLFDHGYISFSEFGDLIVSSKCPVGLLASWAIEENKTVGPFRLAQRPYLAYHRIHVLKI